LRIRCVAETTRGRESMFARLSGLAAGYHENNHRVAARSDSLRRIMRYSFTLNGTAAPSTERLGGSMTRFSPLRLLYRQTTGANKQCRPWLSVAGVWC